MSPIHAVIKNETKTYINLTESLINIHKSNITKTIVSSNQFVFLVLFKRNQILRNRQTPFSTQQSCCVRQPQHLLSFPAFSVSFPAFSVSFPAFSVSPPERVRTSRAGNFYNGFFNSVHVFLCRETLYSTHITL